jgi:CubicO group peptidase (beta-lactamase class C family)
MRCAEPRSRGTLAPWIKLGAKAPLLLACFVAAHAQDSPLLAEALESIRTKHHLPALAAAAVREEKVIALEAVGFRKASERVPVTAEDQWHIGSCTKSMTATLAAMLVEDGKIAWTTTIDAAFPELADAMDPAWRRVTLEHLLAHRGGLPTEPPDNLWRNAWRATGTLTEQRLEFVRGLLLRRPISAPGEGFTYSNQGYAIAGAMLERTTGRPWETLMQERLFTPLGMKSAGFGAPGNAQKLDQPWGHRDAGLPMPVPPGKDADNPAAIGPAGTVHCSIGDFARYAGWHARSIRTTARILGPASFAKLHTPPAGGDYALGWVVLPREWAGGTALMHHGSNTRWFAVMWLAPAKDLAFVAATNVGGKNAEKACDAAVTELLRRSQPK